MSIQLKYMQEWKLNDIQKESYFGPLWKYIKDDAITDIDWDSGQLWIKRVNEIRKPVADPEITESLLNDFAIRVGNDNCHNFNQADNVLCAETDTLRVTCVHDTFSVSGLSLSIRKSLPKLRFTPAEALKSGYCEAKTMHLLANCVLAGVNMVYCGEPGKGKTESAKFFSSFIQDYKKVITVEDTREWHYMKINPSKSCIELKISDEKGYEDSLATALRLNPSWIMLAETRSREVRYLLEAWSNGVSSMTTLHVSDARRIPDRIMNMLENRNDADRIINQIYSDVGIGILMDEEEIGNGKTHHIINQVCFYFREDRQNGYALVVENGILHPERLPDFIRNRIEHKIRGDVFYCKELAERLKREE